MSLIKIFLYNLDPKRLFSFLRSSEHYKMDKALDICKQRNLMKEVVFLLGRGGNRREALKVIIKEQKDIFQAIEFCKVITVHCPVLAKQFNLRLLGAPPPDHGRLRRKCEAGGSTPRPPAASPQE